jgi:hypothetical protein
VQIRTMVAGALFAHANVLLFQARILRVIN